MAIVIRADELLDACVAHDLLPPTDIATHRRALEAALIGLADAVQAATGATLCSVSYDPGFYLAATFQAGPHGETPYALQEQDPEGEWE